MDARIGELLAWECETGRQLPYSAEYICACEDAGAVVNLDTGEVTDCSADTFDVTVVYAALSVVAGCEAVP